MNHDVRYHWLAPCAFATAALAAAQAAAAAVPSLRDAWFARPTAWLAGLHFGADGAALRDGFLLSRPGEEPLLVTTACSGYDFFSLLVAMVVLALSARIGRAGPGPWLGALVAAYAVAIVSNAARVVSVAHVDALAQVFLPSMLADSVHRAAGMAVFLPVLMFVYALVERGTLHELYSHAD